MKKKKFIIALFALSIICYSALIGYRNNNKSKNNSSELMSSK